MSYRFGYEIINDGLVFCMDVLNPNSYKPNSTIWKSIGKDNSYADFQNTIQYEEGEPGLIFASGNDGYLLNSMGYDNLLDVTTTNQLYIQILFSVSTIPSKGSIFSGGYNQSTNVSQYTVGITPVSGFFAAYVRDSNGNEESVNTGIDLDIVRYPYRLLTIGLGTNTNIYFDKLQYGQHSIDVRNARPGNLFTIAKGVDGSNNFYGRISSILIYNRELSIAEIENNYDFLIKRIQ